jgi:hypothetical protein
VRKEVERRKFYDEKLSCSVSYFPYLLKGELICWKYEMEQAKMTKHD